MCLARPSQLADLASLCIDKCQFKPEGVAFLPSGLSKQAKQGKALTDYFLQVSRTIGSFAQWKLCHYLHLATKLRKQSSHLFIALVKPHNPAAPCTIARWLKEALKMSGIDISIFTAHSIRDASSSAAADLGITTSDILKAADWSTESVFRKFYYCPTHNPVYGQAVLSPTSIET